MAWKTLDDMDVAGKTVLVRVDVNVPMENGVVTDATRIEKIAPTLRDLTRKGAKVVLLAHFGRPKGKPVTEMSLRLIHWKRRLATLSHLSNAQAVPKSMPCPQTP
jgi:phosphoglycerate kinase